MNNLVGKLLRIMRYPIKGFSGEEIIQTSLNKHHGIAHDRRWAIRNGSIPQDSTHNWQPCQSFVRMTQHEDLPLYNVDHSEDSLYLRHPNGETISIEKNENHKQRLSSWFSHIDMGLSKSSDNTAYWDHHDAHISIINISTVKAMAKSSGMDIDPDRFRGNLLIDTPEPWSELALVGHRIAIGNAELEVLRPIDRCKSTSVNPSTGTSDINIPHLLSSQYGHVFCGVYARVVRSGKIAKDVFEKMQDNDKDPQQIVEKEGLTQQSDPKELEKIIYQVLSKNKDKVTQYKSGKEKLFGYFVGEVMKVSKGKANPQLVNEILKVKLK